IKVEMPSRLVEFVERQALPARWNRYAQPRATQLLGKAWLDEQRTVALAVPSAVVMDQWNYLLNPLHPRFAELKFSTPQAYRFDRRLFE
ncbi:MAG TPA: RES domain-containing protein, partial [Gemmatales bacterium]|nr:RES domain-containing protein [Gemmatales bacterium]